MIADAPPSPDSTGLDRTVTCGRIRARSAWVDWPGFIFDPEPPTHRAIHVTATMPQDDPPQDRQTLDQLRHLETENPGLIKELIRLFVADAPRQMRLIDSAYRQRDPEGLRQSAHFLRSGALALGMGWLAERAQAFEHLPLGQYGEPASDLQVKELRAGLHQVLLMLLQDLKRL